MPTSPHLLKRVLGTVLISGLCLGSAVAQRAAPSLRDLDPTSTQYATRKLQLAQSLRAATPAAPRQAASPRPRRPISLARPACFEPFDTTAGNGWVQLERDDDNSTLSPVPLGWNFSLFGSTYNQVWINTNGNITFLNSYSEFTSTGFPITSAPTPMIAAFWADVDTRNPASGSVWYKVYPDRLVVTWNRVGYYPSMADKKNSFQIIIRANTSPSFTGDDVTFAYDDMQWTTGNASGGSNGFGGTPASVGADRGNQTSFIQTGRFNQDNATPPNVPNTGDPGGVHYLDNQCIGYQVRAVGNTPPSVTGLPSGNTITVNQGQTVSFSPQFSGPETGQTVTVATNTNGLCNTTVTSNGAANPTLNVSVTGAACNVGTNTISFTATDNGTPVASQTFNVTVIVNPPVTGGQWTGAVSTVYTNAANWSSNSVPTATDDVFIPAGVPNMPVLSAAAAARNITVAPGASLTLASTGTLSLNGNLTNNGTFAGSGAINTTGAALQTFGGNNGISVASLTVNTAGLQLNAPVAVSRIVTLNGNLASNGRLVLLSDALGTAMVVNSPGTAVTGNATVQRFINGSINGGLGYRHFSAPVQNTTVADLATAAFSPVVNPAYNTSPTPSLVTPYPTVFGFDQSRVSAVGSSAADFDKGWVSPNSTGDVMTPGIGYTVNIGANQTVDFVGVLNNGEVARTGLGRGTGAQAGWHLLGNPYPSPINWNAAMAGASGLDNAVYVFKSTGRYSGQYAGFVNGTGVNGGSAVIPLGQGFFVRTSTPGTNGTLILSNGARPTSYVNQDFQRAPEHRTMLHLELQGNGGADEVAVYFQQGATAGFDRTFDAYKLAAGTLPYLAVGAGSEKLSISGLPLLGSSPVTVPLSVWVPQAGTYTLQATELLNLPAGVSVQLRDALTGATTALQPNQPYSFTANPGQTGPRFSLIFTQGRALANAPAHLSEQVSVYPNPTHNQLWLTVPAANKQAVEVTLLNNLGQQVMGKTLPAVRGTEAQQLALGNLASGVYTLRVRLAEGTVTKRVVIQ